MKRFLSCLAFVVCFHMVVFGQQSDENPVLMTVAGKPVTRAEFEYAYNKNNNIEGAVEHKTVEEYAEMFLNYKLKVAEAARPKKLGKYFHHQGLLYLKSMHRLDYIARKVKIQ